MNPDELTQAFRKTFGHAPAGVVRAPGRVNLIGEHTDYNDGFVLPIAIQRETLAAWAPREDGRISLASLQQLGLEDQLDLCEPIAHAAETHKWANYPRGTAAMLAGAGLELPPCDILFSSDVPIGSGLSSSASLEVATALALLAAAGADWDRWELARLCQQAEHEYAGAPCGIMDQAISALGQAGHALLLDCRDGTHRQVPFALTDQVLLVVDTDVHHEINDGGYALRRAQCESAAAKLNLTALRDGDGKLITKAGHDGTLDEKELMRARHVVGEIGRTLRAVEALQAGDLNLFGELMIGSHESLRDDFEVSCDELDAVVEIACRQDGVYGARMTGGGFGGCAIVLARADVSDEVTAAIIAAFQQRFNHECTIFPTHAAAGASVVM
jgi:galactokinase